MGRHKNYRRALRDRAETELFFAVTSDADEICDDENPLPSAAMPEPSSSNLESMDERRAVISEIFGNLKESSKEAGSAVPELAMTGRLSRSINNVDNEIWNYDSTSKIYGSVHTLSLRIIRDEIYASRNVQDERKKTKDFKEPPIDDILGLQKGINRTVEYGVSIARIFNVDKAFGNSMKEYIRIQKEHYVGQLDQSQTHRVISIFNESMKPTPHQISGITNITELNTKLKKSPNDLDLSKALSTFTTQIHLALEALMLSNNSIAEDDLQQPEKDDFGLFSFTLTRGLDDDRLDEEACQRLVELRHLSEELMLLSDLVNEYREVVGDALMDWAAAGKVSWDWGKHCVHNTTRALRYEYLRIELRALYYCWYHDEVQLANHFREFGTKRWKANLMNKKKSSRPMGQQSRIRQNQEAAEILLYETAPAKFKNMKSAASTVQKPQLTDFQNQPFGSSELLAVPPSFGAPQHFSTQEHLSAYRNVAVQMIKDLDPDMLISKDSEEQLQTCFDAFCMGFEPVDDMIKEIESIGSTNARTLCGPPTEGCTHDKSKWREYYNDNLERCARNMEAALKKSGKGKKRIKKTENRAPIATQAQMTKDSSTPSAALNRKTAHECQRPECHGFLTSNPLALTPASSAALSATTPQIQDVLDSLASSGSLTSSPKVKPDLQAGNLPIDEDFGQLAIDLAKCALDRLATAVQEARTKKGIEIEDLLVLKRQMDGLRNYVDEIEAGKTPQLEFEMEVSGGKEEGKKEVLKENKEGKSRDGGKEGKKQRHGKKKGKGKGRGRK